MKVGQVNFNAAYGGQPRVSMTQFASQGSAQPVAQPVTPPATQQVETPAVQQPTQAPENVEVQKTKTSFKEKTANIWKFFSATNQMVLATMKGVFYGAVTAVGLLAGSFLFKALPNAFTKEGPTLWNTIKHPLKSVGKSGKIIAGVGATAVLGYQLVLGRLEANQKTAVIDHKMRTGHRDK